MNHAGQRRCFDTNKNDGRVQCSDQEEGKMEDLTNNNDSVSELVYTFETEDQAGSQLKDTVTLPLSQSCSNINSDVIMEKLFEACDPDGKGKVKVSHLLDYLGTIVELNEDGAVGQLIEILDPDNINTEIGIQTLQSGFQRWMEEMKSDTPLERSSSSTHTESMSFEVSVREGMEASLLDASVMEDGLSVADLSSQLTDCLHQIRKLTDENNEARTLIETKEEELLKLTREITDGRREIKRLKELADFRHEAEAENEELKQQLITLGRDFRTEERRNHQAEQEKTLLQTQLQRYQAQVARLNTELAASKQLQEDLRSSLIENKERVALLRDACSILDTQQAEKEEQFQELKVCLRSLSKTNEDLISQNQELQGELIDSQQEVISLKSAYKTNNGISVPSLEDLAYEIEEDSEFVETESLSEWPSSIQNELRDVLSDNPNLPWPLSEKELQDSVAVIAPDVVSQVGKASNSPRNNTDEDPIQSQRDVPEGASVDSGDAVVFQEKHPKDRDIHYDISNEKLRFLVSLLKSLKEENQKLRHIVKTNIMDTKDSCRVTESDETKHTCGEETCPEFLDVKCQMMEEELATLRQCLSESELTLNKLQKRNDKLVSEVTRLKRSNISLAEKLHKSELKISELAEEAHTSSLCLEKEKQRCADLEEDLCSSTLARQLDLRDIWRLVQKDVEIECHDKHDEDLCPSSTNQLKERIKTDIETLRGKLEKHNSELKVLKKNLDLPLSRHLYLRHWNGNGKSSPGSPLVDALSIDMFNGNLLMYQPKYPFPPSVVSCEDVDCHECLAARLVLQSRYTASCPSIASSNFTKQQWQDDHNNYSERSHETTEPNIYEDRESHPSFPSHYEGDSNQNYEPNDFSQGLNQNFSTKNPTDTGTCTDSDATTSSVYTDYSGTSDQPKKQRSLYGNHRRQDFIRRSGRGPPSKYHQTSNTNPAYLEKKGNISNLANNNHIDFTPVGGRKVLNNNFQSNNLFVDSSSIEADNHDPHFGVRRSSFRRAIENNLQKNFDPEPETLPRDFSQRQDNLTEELRRPSFNAAIEHGKDGHVTPNTPSKGKNVHISSPEVLDSKLTKNDKNEKKNGPTCETSKTVKFVLGDQDCELYGRVYTGALAWSPSGQKADLKAIASSSCSSQTSSLSSSSRSSTWASASPFSSFSSFSGPGSLNRSLSLASRTSSFQHPQYQMLTEESSVAKSMEDWDMSPNTTINSDYFPDSYRNEEGVEEEEEGHLNRSLCIEEHTNVKEGLDSTDDMPASMNPPQSQTTPHGKEVIRSHNARDGPGHPTSERCARALENKATTTNHNQPSVSLQSSTSRRGQHASNTTTSSLSSSSQSTSSPSSTTTGTTTTPSSVSAFSPPGALQKSSSKSQGNKKGEIKESSESGTSHTKRNSPGSEDSSSEVESTKVKTVVPASPPTPRGTLSPTQQAPPLGPSRLSRIRQNHLASKKREQMKARTMKLPEVAEHSELETTQTISPTDTRDLNGSATFTLEKPPKGHAMPQISVTDEKAELPPAPSEESVTPSLPESFLRKLGLAVKASANNNNDDDNDDDISVDQLPEKEIESKFVSLSLAFKTDKLTVDQRVSVQERSRDLAEQNVDTELHGLREAAETLKDLVSDDQVRNIIKKIKQHLDVLEQAAARVSSRAEVYGAVQQERRMCKAMEVMVLYTENLRRIREREESELQEARKVLSERSGNGYSLDSESGPNRRSMSVCGFNPGGRPSSAKPFLASCVTNSMAGSGDCSDMAMRRRSEIVLPRILGGAGSPSLSQTSSMDASPLTERSNTAYHFPSTSLGSEEGEDPKSRFQSAVASTSMQHAVANTMRRVSLEKQRSGSLTSSSSMSPTSGPASPFSLKPSSNSNTLSVTKEVEAGDSGSENSDGKKTGERKVSQDEEAYRKGFEQGLKAKLSQELNELRDQQNSISQNLEHVMDKVDQSQLEDEELLSRPSRIERTIALASVLRIYMLQYDWRSNKKAIRNVAGLFFLFLAFLVVFLSPPISTVDVRHFSKPPQ